MEHLFPYPKMGTSFLEVLQDPLTRKLLGFEAIHAEKTPFISGVSSRFSFLLNDATNHLSFLKIGYTALEAFLQSNCTGPPLPFEPAEFIFPETYRNDEGIAALQKDLLRTLSVDGMAAYALTPHVELFWLAKLIMSNTMLAEAGFNGRRARFRVNFWHQKLLSEHSDTLHDQIYADAEILEQQLASRLIFDGAAAEEHFVEFLIERAIIQTYYGDDSKAREDLIKAATTRNFQFALTGHLGKRTKFQVTDISQLVVLAKSRDAEPEPYSSRKGSRADVMDSRRNSQPDSRVGTPRLDSPTNFSRITKDLNSLPRRPKSPPSSKALVQDVEQKQQHYPPPTSATAVGPENIPLNDDTLLEHINFTQAFKPEPTSISDQSKLPPSLLELDPANQPLLFPMDSVILLAMASSISNTSPADGLTREETLPYATRVLDGGSSNWQVYTQALLVRSRIEGYRSRTAERGLLQLQALVDQVIAETTPDSSSLPKPSDEASDSSAPTTFLPKPNSSESASVPERLQYVHQLSPPFRWELEAELAARWTSMGGLKTALEIYERLKMNAEVALCLSATDREPEAINTLKELLFEEPSEPSTNSDSTILTLRNPPPADAPRLLCILGDITSTPTYYSLSWKASKYRYARAQRSLGRYFVRKRDYSAAAEAYNLALSSSKVDGPTWFALGCVQLELENWFDAVDSFTRCVQLEDKDAEAWSNLAVALLRLPPPTDNSSAAPIETSEEDDEEVAVPASDPSQYLDPYLHSREALRALRRAATLKRDDARIWDNYLTVAAGIPPSAGTPWNDIIQAMQRVIELRSKKEGESSIDVKILKVLINYVTSEYTYPSQNETDPPEETPTDAKENENEPTKLPHLARFLLQLIDKNITPLVTSNSELYLLLAQVALWRHRPAESLSYHEKSWRATTAVPNVYDSETGWKSVAGTTISLAKQYQELGPQTRERTGGQVESGWKFKARNAIRNVLGRSRDNWEDTKEFQTLKEMMEELKN